MQGASYTKVTKDLVVQTLPNIASQMAIVACGFISVIVVSFLNNPDVLGAVGAGNMIQNVLGSSLGIGLNSGLDTLVSQSNGAGQFKRSGMFFHRACMVSVLTCIPASIILYFTGAILTAIGQDPVISEMAGQYVRGSLIGLLPMYLFNAIGGYLRAQQLPNPNFYVTWTATAMHVVFCYVLVITMQMGSFGAGLALSLTNIVSFVLLFSWVQFVRPGVTKESWIRPDFASAIKLRGFLEVSLPSALLIWSEWWCCEIMTILAGYVGVNGLAAHTSVMQLFIVLYMVPGGLSFATASMVGNAIGAHDADLAKRISTVSITGTVIISVSLNVFVWTLRDPIATMFTTNDALRENIFALLYILMYFMPLDTFQTIIDGILRGLGKQALAFRVKSICMWAVRLPAAGLLAFTFHYGVAGIWWGNCAGMVATSLVYVVLLWRINWEEATADANSYRLMRDSYSPVVSGAQCSSV